MKKRFNKEKSIITSLIFILIASVGLYISYNQGEYNQEENSAISTASYEITDIPEYSGNIFIEINNNIPKFNEEDFNLEEDYYSELKDGKVRNGNDKN